MNDWLTASAILLSGLVVGFMFVYSMKRAARTGEAERRDLQAKLDARVQQLRELEDVGGSDEERARLEREAADALRELEGVEAAASAAGEGGRSDRPHTEKKPTGPLAGFLWGAGSVAAIAALIFFVTSSSKQRGANEGLTGGQPTGAAPMQSAPAASDPEIQRLEAAVKATPDDLALRDDLAKAHLDRENMPAVVEQTRYVLQRSPTDARALTYEALVLIAMNRVDTALPMLEKSVKSDPSLLETQVALAWIYTNAGHTAEAEAAMKEAFARHPEERAKLTEVFARMKAGPAPNEAPQQQQQAAAPSGPSVHVTINVPDNVRISGTALVFVYARAAGVTSGPPAAVKRLPASGFPIAIDLSAADSMMGQPLPEKMRIEARLDGDGNAMTKEPGDLTAFAEGVVAGANITLSLR
ncbi:MAG: cytochrome c-type biosis protein CcmH [Acidobacteriota bacterium]|jgi:cytochrome c-type biogenesis protein CcmH|nr:cytochrome c-type biosis protein CcmH [Acidobacteriota bacterium]